ncbi:MAG: hypothetical protein STHCBS139747_005085 [Sporothrix thermara]
MNLSFKAIHDVVHATAAFSGHTDDSSDDEIDVRDGMRTPSSVDEIDFDSEEHVSWAMSQLNPKNRIDSLEPVAKPKWRIDGAAGLGTQFYAYPVFLPFRPPPMKIEVFIADISTHPRNLRRLLDLEQVFHTKDRSRVRRLGIASHVQRILQHHSTHKDGQLSPSVVESLFLHGPFGSMIIIENLTYDVKESQLIINPNHPLEGELMSYVELKTMWKLTDSKRHDGGRLPPEVDIHSLGLVRQLHDSISLVEYTPEKTSADSCGKVSSSSSSSSHHNKTGTEIGHWLNQISQFSNASKARSTSEASSIARPIKDKDGHMPSLLILKSVSSQVKFLYQELRALLKDIPPHESILSRPLHIITKKCLFGLKAGVIGFTMPFYPLGSVRDILPLLRIHGQLTFEVQMRWSCQITDALLHMWTKADKFYYPDLRLDNIVIAGPGWTGDIGIVDFEQRGVWCSFSAPEVDFIESLRVLAFDDQDYEYANAEDVCNEFLQKLVDCYDAAALIDPPPPLPAHLSSKNHAVLRLEEVNMYSNPWNGYNVPWNCMTNVEKEAAMVYMLGRVLWCIGEGMSAPHRGAIWQSYPYEPEIEFPNFSRTPEALRDIINKCFGDAGAREQSQFVRQCSKLYIKEPLDTAAGAEGGDVSSGDASKPAYKLVSEDLASKAREFWHARLAEGDAWLKKRNKQLREQSSENGHGTVTSLSYGDTKECPRSPDGSHMEVSAHGRPTLRQVLQWLTELEMKEKG